MLSATLVDYHHHTAFACVFVPLLALAGLADLLLAGLRATSSRVLKAHAVTSLKWLFCRRALWHPAYLAGGLMGGGLLRIPLFIAAHRDERNKRKQKNISAGGNAVTP